VAYTTPDEVRAVLSAGGSADTNSAAGLSDELLLGAITDARVEIDARIAVRYPSPFDDPDASDPKPVPPLVARVNRDIAAYLATLTFLRGAPLSADSPVALRYVASQNLLGGIAKGTVTLDLPGGREEDQPAENVNGGATVVNTYDGSMFTAAGFGIGRAIGPFGNQLGRPYPQDTY
jgi:phage gp36-like protein